MELRLSGDISRIPPQTPIFSSSDLFLEKPLKILTLDKRASEKQAHRKNVSAELIDTETRYDVRKYVAMLILAGANILSPFGYNEKGLKDEICYGERQIVLKPTLAITKNAEHVCVIRKQILVKGL